MVDDYVFFIVGKCYHGPIDIRVKYFTALIPTVHGQMSGKQCSDSSVRASTCFPKRLAENIVHPLLGGSSHSVSG